MYNGKKQSHSIYENIFDYSSNKSEDSKMKTGKKNKTHEQKWANMKNIKNH